MTATPGPWTIRRSNDGSGDVGITADGLPNVLAECFGDLRHSGERASDEAYANARLIAAAPDMLAALQAQEAADEANEVRLNYTEWQALEDIAKALRVAAISKAVQS